MANEIDQPVHPLELFRKVEEGCLHLQTLWRQAEAVGHDKADGIFESLQQGMTNRLMVLDAIRAEIPHIPDVEPDDRHFGITEFQHINLIITALSTPHD